MDNYSKHVNVLIWAFKKESALKVLNDITKSQYSKEDSKNCIEIDNYNVKYKKICDNNSYKSDYYINFYIRYNNQQKKVAPEDLIDIIILSTDKTSYGLAKEYLDTRKSIPFKYVTGYDFSDNNKENTTFNNKLVFVESIENNSSILENGIQYSLALKDVFNKIDIDNSGYLDRNEIIKASKELNHDLSDGDANEIISIMGKEGKISFTSFKHWWYLGRFDFSSFRSLISLKVKVSKFLDDKFFNNLTSYSSGFLFDDNELNKEDFNNNKDYSMNSKISIYPVEEEDRKNHKTSVNLHLSLGHEFDKIKENFPSYYNEALIIGIEIPLKNNAKINNITNVNELNVNDNYKTLEKINLLIKNYLFDNNQGILSELYSEQGVVLNSRLNGDIAIIEIVFGGPIGEYLMNIVEKSLNYNIKKDLSKNNESKNDSSNKLPKIKKDLDFYLNNYSGHLDAHISSKFCFKSMFEDRNQNFLNLAKEALKVNIEEKSNFKSLYFLIKSAFVLCKKLMTNNNCNNNKSYYEKLIKKFESIVKSMKAISIIKDFDISINYDVDELYNLFPDSFKETLLVPLNMLFAPLFGLYDSCNPKNILKDSFDIIEKCDLDKLSIFIYTPVLRFLLKASFIIEGLNTLINKTYKES